MAETLILFRTHRDTPFIRERLTYLSDTSGVPVVVALDATQCDGFKDVPTLRLSPEELAGQGLHIPPEFGWQAGDYAFYAARKAYPDVKHFWLIEYDVLMSFPKASDFFDLYTDSDKDMLVGRLKTASPKWYWHKSMAGEGRVMRCLFPVVRLSAKAIDALYRKRVQMSEQASAMCLWPNDEAFVASTVANLGMATEDLNARAKVYGQSSFRYNHPISIEAVKGRHYNLLLHPVLDAQELAAKRQRVKLQGMRARISAAARRGIADVGMFWELRGRSQRAKAA